MPIEYKFVTAEVKKFDDENLIVEHFISTEHKDRGGDVMRAKGMKVIGKPVVLLLHGRGAMGSEPIGKPLSIDVDEFKGQPGILAKTQFFPDEVGNRLYQKVKGGFLPNWSIGYMVDEAKDLLREGKYDGRDVTKWTLLEYSPVGVPMNPFAQTVKEFLDKVDKGEEVKVEESRWFGFVDVKDCKDCGQGCEKHYEEKPFANEHSCRVKDPDQFPKKRRENDKFGDGIHAIWGIKDDKAHLQAIRFSTDKFTADQAKAWAKDHDHTCILFEPATGKEEDTPEAEPELLTKIVEEEISVARTEAEQIKDILAKWDGLQGQILMLPKTFKEFTDAIENLKERLTKLEPLLKSLPPEPDGGEKGDGSQDNPPEKIDPPRLVFRDSAKELQEEERRKAEERDRTVAAVAEAIRPVFKAQVDKLMGRVP
jgi:hypothetical protein